MKETQALIIGAGLTGLSAAYFLNKSIHCLICEKEEKVGGLCRTNYINGFYFDLTGHLLHLANYEIEKFLLEDLKINLASIKRKSAIFLYNRYIPYPFQVNTFPLPAEIIYECIYDFIMTKFKAKKFQPKNFREWLIYIFGKGICKHFMFPYNEKLWLYNLSKISTEWVWTIPQPEIEDVLKGALGIADKMYGYNPIFYYPSNSGIEILPNTLSSYIPNILTNHEILSIDYKNKIAHCKNGELIKYNILINTIPINKFLLILKNAPALVYEYAHKLKYVKVINFNIGIKKYKASPYHWIYFPEANFPFYRIGFYTNFTEALAPPNTTSMYIEVSCRQNEKIDVSETRDKVIKGLMDMGYIDNSSDIIAEQATIISPAYVIFDFKRSKIIARIKRFLAKNHIYTTGRFGSWDYSSMESALLNGKKIAQMIPELIAHS